MSEPLRRIKKHWNSNFKVRLRANTVDPTVRSETLGGNYRCVGVFGLLVRLCGKAKTMNQ